MLMTTYENATPFEQPKTASLFPEGIKPVRSTVSALVFFWAISSNTPQFAITLPTDQPGFVDNATQSIQHHKTSLVSLSDYIIDDNDIDAVNEYLNAQPLASFFLNGLVPILDRVYQGAARAKINICIDPDTDAPILEVVVLSGLSIDEDFFAKDRLLFEELQQAGLSEELRHVVLSQG